MPGTDPKGLMSYNANHSIVPQAYSPLGGDAHASLLGSDAVKEIALAHNATVGQVSSMRTYTQRTALSNAMHGGSRARVVAAYDDADDDDDLFVNAGLPTMGTGPRLPVRVL